MDTHYRALVYLTQEVDTGLVKGIPCLHTKSHTDKRVVLDFARALHKQNIIQAYRMCMSPDGHADNWYNDSEVVYLEENAPIVCGIFHDE